LNSIRLLIDKRIPKDSVENIVRNIPKNVFFLISDKISEAANAELWDLVIAYINEESPDWFFRQFKFARAFIFLFCSAVPSGFWNKLQDQDKISDKFVDLNPSFLELSLRNALMFIEKVRSLEELESEKRFFDLFTNFQGPKIRRFIIQLKEVSNIYQDIALISEEGCRRSDFCNYISNGQFLSFDLSKIPETSVHFKLFEADDKAVLAIGNGFIFLDNFDNSSLEFQKEIYKLMLKRFYKNGGKKIDFSGRILLGVNEKSWENISGEIKNLLGKAVLRIPPLRERAEDIPYMIDHLISVYGNRLRKNIFYPSREIVEFLKNYNWPGNFEEFEELLTEFIVMGNENGILKQAISRMVGSRSNSLEIGELPKLKDITKKMVSHIEKDLISRALEMSSRNKKKASKLLGISYKTLVQKMKKHGIK